MKIIRTIKSLKKELLQYNSNRDSIGFVPTMGSIHSGHLFLIQKSILENQKTICSIYINPTQFNDKEDLLNYPREELDDIKKLERTNCDIVFIPNDVEMYPHTHALMEKYNFTDCFDKLEGQKRPGHFLGVVTIVHKLFNLIRPNRAYFGEKDYQQLWIIQLFVKTYKLPTQIIPCKTVRNNLGLALSSRNKLLSEIEKKEAIKIFKSIDFLKRKIEQSVFQDNHQIFNEQQLYKLKKTAIQPLLSSTLIKLDYCEIIETETFSFANYIEYNKTYQALIAVYVGKVRLIDNISIN